MRTTFPNSLASGMRSMHHQPDKPIPSPRSLPPLSWRQVTPTLSPSTQRPGRLPSYSINTTTRLARKLEPLKQLESKNLLNMSVTDTALRRTMSSHPAPRTEDHNPKNKKKSRVAKSCLTTSQPKSKSKPKPSIQEEKSSIISHNPLPSSQLPVS